MGASDAAKRALSPGQLPSGRFNSTRILCHVADMPQWNSATAGDVDRSRAKPWSLSPAIAAFAGVALSLLVWSWVGANADQRAAAQFREQARVMSTAIFNRSRALEQTRRSLAMLLALVPKPPEEQFTLAARSILEPNTGFVAVAWAPLVKSIEREDWQRETSQRVGRKILVCDRSP